MWRVLLLAVLAGACTFDADYAGSRYRCGGELGACPSGFECVDNRCVQPGASDARADLADGRSDGPPGDAAPVDVCAEAAVAPVADTCSDGDARDLTGAARDPGGTRVHGDTTGYANDLGSPPASCSGIGVITTGADAIYTVALENGDRLTVSLAAEGWDSALYLATLCDGSATCLAGDDQTFDTAEMTQPLEEVVHTATAPERLYVLVDSVRIPSQLYATGCFTLAVTIE